MTSTGYDAISTPEQNLGLDFVDQVRRETGINLSSDRVRHSAGGWFDNPVIQVSEAVARKTGLFGKQNQVNVHVDRGQLNKYCVLTVELNKDNETGEIKEAWGKYILNENDVLRDWAEIGFPLEWQQVVAESEEESEEDNLEPIV